MKICINHSIQKIENLKKHKSIFNKNKNFVYL